MIDAKKARTLTEQSIAELENVNLINALTSIEIDVTNAIELGKYKTDILIDKYSKHEVELIVKELKKLGYNAYQLKTDSIYMRLEW